MLKKLLGFRHFLEYRCRLSLPWSSYALGKRTRLWFGHECSGHRMLSEHEREYGLGHGCSGHRMLLEHERDYGLGHGCSGHRMLLEHELDHGLGHGCSGHSMLWEHELDYGLGMDALVIVCSGNTNEIIVWA